MISFALASALFVAAAPPPDRSLAARKGYSACLTRFIRESLDAKLDPAAFDGALIGACSAEHAAFRAAIIERDLGMGLKRNVAEQGAGEELADMLATTKERFRDHTANGTTP